MEGDRAPKKVITYIFWYQQLILTVAHMIFGCGTWKWGLPPVVAIKSFGKWWTTIFWGTLYGTPRSNKPKHVYNVYQPKTTFYVILVGLTNLELVYSGICWVNFKTSTASVWFFTGILLEYVKQNCDLTARVEIHQPKAQLKGHGGSKNTYLRHHKFHISMHI